MALFCGLFGALSGLVSGFLLANIVCAAQRRRGFKSAPAYFAQMLFGALVSSVGAAIASRFFAPTSAVLVGAAAWPLVFLAIASLAGLTSR